MRALAAELAAAHDGLDFSLASLGVLEQVVRAGKKQRAASLEQWGAYLGETMIRAAAEGAMRWLDFPAAAQAVPSVARLGHDAETAAVLIAGETCWFPLVKINKFLDHGAQDSPAAFARVAVASTRPRPPAPPPDPATMPPAAVAAVRAFFAAPSVATLRALSNSRTHLREPELVLLFREHGAIPPTFHPFFAAPPEGRGLRRYDPARTAAREVWTLLQHGLADPAAETAALTTMLTSRDARVRENAAYVLGRYHFQLGTAAAAAAQYDHGDAAIRTGTLEAIASVVNVSVMKRGPLRPTADFVPILAAALRGTPSERTLALAAIHQISVRVRADITALLDPLLDVLATGKPAQLESALQSLGAHAGSILAGRSPFDARIPASIPTIIRHLRPLPGSQKQTKVQIAARSTLRTYARLTEHLSAADLAEIEQSVR